MRVNKWRQNLNVWVNCSFKTHIASDHLLSIFHSNKQGPYIWRRVNLCAAREAENVTSHYGNQLCACFLLFRRWKNTWANQPSDSSRRDARWQKGKKNASAVLVVSFTQGTIFHCKLQTLFMRAAYECFYLLFFFFFFSAGINILLYSTQV